MTITKYKYKDIQYDSIYELSETLGKEGVFIPLTLSDEDLTNLGVTVSHEEEPIEDVKQQKIMILKTIRDAAEVQPIEYKGNTYDFDSKARDRINAAIIALEELDGTDGKLTWTTADNKDVEVTAEDLRMIIATVAVRSNKLHTAYRAAKAQVEAAGTADEVRAVTMN